MENKYKEEMAPGGTNALGVEHTVWSAWLMLWPEEGIVSVGVKENNSCYQSSLKFGLQAVWTQQLKRKCQRMRSQEKLIKKTSGPAVLNGKSPPSLQPPPSQPHSFETVNV